MKIDQLVSKQEIVIFGAGIVARGLIIALKESIGLERVHLIGCVVSSKQKNVKEVENIPVFSIEEFSQEHKDALIIMAVRDSFKEDVIRLLKQYGMEHVEEIAMDDCISVLKSVWERQYPDIAEAFEQRISLSELTQEEQIIFLSKQLRKEALNFEVSLAEHCNLNCQSCNHFSPLAEKKFLDVSEYEMELRRLTELFGKKIGRVMLVGGEPLLHPRLEDIMDISRQYLPDAPIYFITNGLLFPKMKESFWRKCRKNVINIKVTQYPVKFDYAYWECYAKNQGIDISNENPERIKTTYRLPLHREGQFNPYVNYAKCYHANQCVVLREGRLYTCPISAWIDMLNRYYGESFPQMEANSIDIYETEDSREIEWLLKQPVPMCEYCDIAGYEYNIPWRTSRKDKAEWIQATELEKID